MQSGIVVEKKWALSIDLLRSIEHTSQISQLHQDSESCSGSEQQQTPKQRP